MKMIKKIFFVSLLSFVIIVATVSTIYYFRFNITIFDRATDLDLKTEIIEVSYINWACDCPDYIETKYYKNNPAYETREEDCIFIEPSEASLKVPESFDHFHKVLKLSGHFYKNKGIPTSYEMKTPEKPDKARVFRYDKIEFVDR